MDRFPSMAPIWYEYEFAIHRKTDSVTLPVRRKIPHVLCDLIGLVSEMLCLYHCANLTFGCLFPSFSMITDRPSLKMQLSPLD